MVAKVTKKLTMSTREVISYIREDLKVISELETIWEEMNL